MTGLKIEIRVNRDGLWRSAQSQVATAALIWRPVVPGMLVELPMIDASPVHGLMSGVIVERFDVSLAGRGMETDMAVGFRLEEVERDDGTGLEVADGVHGGFSFGVPGTNQQRRRGIPMPLVVGWLV